MQTPWSRTPPSASGTWACFKAPSVATRPWQASRPQLICNREPSPGAKQPDCGMRVRAYEPYVCAGLGRAPPTDEGARLPHPGGREPVGSSSSCYHSVRDLNRQRQARPLCPRTGKKAGKGGGITPSIRPVGWCQVSRACSTACWTTSPCRDSWRGAKCLATPCAGGLSCSSTQIWYHQRQHQCGEVAVSTSPLGSRSLSAVGHGHAGVSSDILE
jgi:hypothetical protein